ncbi:MAG: M3 family oligoendopeptidase, partial [Anaerolineae bacterium]|nr:M3 family oligoendopeptidase [Anaerolineae bacterium]
MFEHLPKTTQEFAQWPWEQIAPYFDNLDQRALNATTVDHWLANWTHLDELLSETYARLHVATTQDTTDEAAEKLYHAFLENILPHAETAEQKLKEKLLASGLEPDGFAIPLRDMRAEAALFREENLPLLVQERKIISEFNRVQGTQTVEWDGEERTLLQMEKLQIEPDRDLREKAWCVVSQRILADRDRVNELWGRFMHLRRAIAQNAGYDSYRAYKWQQRLRFDYTPDDCTTFHNAIEEVVVPAATRIYEKRRAQLGVDTLRPWD